MADKLRLDSVNAQFEVFSSVNKIPEHLAGFGKILWIGALSFEARCSTSLSRIMLNDSLNLSRIIVLDYTTNVWPKDKGELKRETNWAVIQKLSEQQKSVGVVRKPTPAHIYQYLQDHLVQEFSDPSIDSIVIDISCFTKIHALATAYVLANLKRQIKWCIAYTIPENYGFVADPRQEMPSWRDIVIAPFAEIASLFNEASGRGIILPGHEADRLRVALAEIEPAGGSIVLAESKGRPDLRMISERKNRKTIQQLQRKESSKWLKHNVALEDLRSLIAVVSQEILLAKKHDAPVILFPYGPKSFIFAIAYQLAIEYPESSWFVYPIPSSYDAFYSFGVQATSWILPFETSGGPSPNTPHHDAPVVDKN